MLMVFFATDFSAFAQLESENEAVIPVREPHFPPPLLPGRDEIIQTRDWDWECLGPEVQPKELNPGGKAIPAYAANRGNGTGRINYLYVSPRNNKRVWACSPTGGLWYTKDQGQNWLSGGTDQLPVSGVSSIAVNSRNSSQWFVATGDCDDLFMFTDGVWRTRNRGKTWENINGQDPNAKLPFLQSGDIYSFICEIATNPIDFDQLVVASNAGLFITNNATDKLSKIKWRKIADGYFYDVEMIVNGKQLAIVASGNKLVVSKDGGINFVEMPLPSYKKAEEFPFLRISVELNPADKNKLVCAVTCSQAASMSSIGEGTLQEFDIETKTWKLIRSLKDDQMNNMIPTRARAFAVSPVDSDHIICGNVQPLYISHDHGATFSKIESRQMHDDVHHIEFSADGKVVWAAHDGGVSMSRDGGLHWQNRDNGIGAANIFGLSTAQTESPQVLYGGYDTGGNLLKDGTWWHVTWGDGFESVIDKSNPDIMISTKQNGSLNKCVDGTSFERGISPPSSGSEWHTWIRQNQADPNTIYCGGSKLTRSNDLGETWEPIFQPSNYGDHLYNAYRFFLSEDHPSVMYVYVLDDSKIHPEIWRSFNINAPEANEISWEKVADIPHEGWIISIEMDPKDPNRFWLLYNMYDPQGKIYFFDGSAYEDYTANLGSCKTEAMILQRGNERRLYVGSNYGVFTRTPRDTSWTLMKGLPGTFIKSLDINYSDGKLIVGTFGRGVWMGDLFGN